MTRIDYDFDPNRVNLDLRDPRLKRLMLRDPERCATLNEYADATGMDTSEIAEAIGHYLDGGEMSLELYAEEIFLHTAPNGRLPGSNTINVPPNLWEHIRERCDVAGGYALWQMIRSLQRAGWAVEHRLPKIMFGLAAVHNPPYLGVVTGNTVVPTLLFPTASALSSPAGLLEQYEHAGAPAVAVICEERALDEVATSVRRWILARRVPALMSILVLEAPRYNPVLLSPSDGAVHPVAVTRDTLGNYFW